jgi:ABC-2 type transport system ATP-binding protein
MTTIVLESVVKAYGAVTALDGLSFAPVPGRVTGFVGPNGAGKTTALRILLGWPAPRPGGRRSTACRTPTCGTRPGPSGALLAPEAFHPGAQRARRPCACWPASWASATRGWTSCSSSSGSPTRATRRVGTYSLGMRQRLALAAALLGDPAALVLDEPTNGLDPYGVRWLRELVRTLAAEGRTVIVSSHQLAELGQTVDDVALVDRGRVVEHAPLAELPVHA